MSKCQAVQQSDEMFCAGCDLRWSVNDPNPPKCLHKERLAQLTDEIHMAETSGHLVGCDRSKYEALVQEHQEILNE